MKLTKAQKKKELLAEREKIQTRLNDLYKHFRGVRHEDSASEMKYTTIKVYEAHIASIDKELEKMEEKV